MKKILKRFWQDASVKMKILCFIVGIFFLLSCIVWAIADTVLHQIMALLLLNATATFAAATFVVKTLIDQMEE